MKKQIVGSVILGSLFIPNVGAVADTIVSTEDKSSVETIHEETTESKQGVGEMVIPIVESNEPTTMESNESEEIDVPSEPELPEESTDSSAEVELPDESDTPEVPEESEEDGTVPSETEEVGETAETSEETSITESEAENGTIPSAEEVISEPSETQENRLNEEMSNPEDSTQSLKDESSERSTSQAAAVNTLPNTGSQESTFTSFFGLLLTVGSFLLLKRKKQ